MSTEVKVAALPDCDICQKAKAQYDAKTITGQWGYMCQQCYDVHGLGLGLGVGQKLVVA